MLFFSVFFFFFFFLVRKLQAVFPLHAAFSLNNFHFSICFYFFQKFFPPVYEEAHLSMSIVVIHFFRFRFSLCCRFLVNFYFHVSVVLFFPFFFFVVIYIVVLSFFNMCILQHVYSFLGLFICLLFIFIFLLCL